MTRIRFGDYSTKRLVNEAEDIQCTPADVLSAHARVLKIHPDMLTDPQIIEAFKLASRPYEDFCCQFCGDALVKEERDHCCDYCFDRKGDITFKDFQKWIDRVVEHQL